MKKFILIFLSSIIIPFCCFAEGEYNVFTTPHLPKFKSNNETQTLFILDYSNSMNEMLLDKTKHNLLIDSIRTLLPQISGNKIGVRIYGHRWGLTPFDACKASSLVVPINNDNEYFITDTLRSFRPRGMTPITYSLKQAVKNDFKQDDKEKHIILITDGGENCDESPCKYAMELIKYRKDIKIDVIAFNVPDSDDLAQLKCTADVTGGHFIEADTNAELLNSMQELILPHKQVEALIYGVQ